MNKLRTSIESSLLSTHPARDTVIISKQKSSAMALFMGILKIREPINMAVGLSPFI